MGKKLCLLFAVLFTFAAFSSCGYEVVKSHEASPILTQTKVVLDSLPTERAEYADFFTIARPVFFTPGLLEDLIPQGLCYSPDEELVIISGYYMQSAFPSRLALIDNRSGELISSVGLKDTSGEAFYGHVGGIACSENTIFITCESEAYFISLYSLKKAENNSEISFEGKFKLGTRGSFANYEEGILWTGDFVENKKSELENAPHIVTLPSGETLYARCEGYKLSGGLPDEKRRTKNEEGYVPHCFLAIPTQTQGMARMADGRFVFSLSYGRKNDSKIAVYEDIFLKNAYKKIQLDGFSVPLYCFTEDTMLKEFNAIPMSQGMDRVKDKLFLLFESGADFYRNGGGRFPTDYVFELEIS
ncbi:MAG: hypothetical protein BWY46_01472 [Firmicutes bacterium ADurb.Bin300]|nr:MAG: hypothetical protein BWY46_01472 [Firmicutes bacterium ADurb.Bin300]